jgi:hypothetical protein
LKKAHFLQKIPYHQCGIALRKDFSVSGAASAKPEIEIRKFTSLGEEKWTAEHDGITHEEYMI